MAYDDPAKSPGSQAAESTQNFGDPPPSQTPTADSADPVNGRDRLGVHFVWEAVLFVLVLLGAGGIYLTNQNLPDAADFVLRTPMGVTFVSVAGLAVALAWSVRAGVPNLAVGWAAALSGALFVSYQGLGTAAGLGIALCGVAAMGLLIAVIVLLLRTPAWVGSLAVGIGAVGAAGPYLTQRPGRSPFPFDSVDALTTYPWAVLVAIAVLSLLGGLLSLIGPVRRFVGAARSTGNPPERRGFRGGFAAVVALVASSLLAGLVGLIQPVYGSAALLVGNGLNVLLPVLAAVLIGGVSLYGRRGGLFGTVLGVLLVFEVLVLVQELFSSWFAITTSAVLVLLGLLVTRMVERFGEPRRPEVVVGVPVLAGAAAGAGAVAADEPTVPGDVALEPASDPDAEPFEPAGDPDTGTTEPVSSDEAGSAEGDSDESDAGTAGEITFERSDDKDESGK